MREDMDSLAVARIEQLLDEVDRLREAQKHILDFINGREWHGEAFEPLSYIDMILAASIAHEDAP